MKNLFAQIKVTDQNFTNYAILDLVLQIIVFPCLIMVLFDFKDFYKKKLYLANLRNCNSVLLSFKVKVKSKSTIYMHAKCCFLFHNVKAF